MDQNEYFISPIAPGGDPVTWKSFDPSPNETTTENWYDSINPPKDVATQDTAGSVPGADQEYIAKPTDAVSASSGYNKSSKNAYMDDLIKSNGNKVGWSMLADIGSQLYAYGNQREASKAGDYVSQMEQWKADGKTWMDPNSDLRPDIGTYLDNMPSRVQAGMKSNMFSGIGMALDNKKITNFSAAPVPDFGVGAAKGQKVSAQDFVNPAGYVGKLFGASDEQVNYIWGQSTDGFARGLASGGIIGGAIGGVVGIIKGALGYNDALEADRAARRKALADYEKALAEWTLRRNKRLVDQRNAYLADARARSDAAEAKAKTKKAEKAVNIANMRKGIVDALTSANNVREINKQKRIAQWRS